jgi:hypothetical protein
MENVLGLCSAVMLCGNGWQLATEALVQHIVQAVQENDSSWTA